MQVYSTLRMVRQPLPDKIPFPESAYKKYIPLRVLGYGAHGRVIVCAVRHVSPNGHNDSNGTGTYNLVAIKVVESIGPIHLPDWHYNDEFRAVEMLKMFTDGIPDLKPLNVPTIIDIGFTMDTKNWTSWYAMEALPGCTLGEIERLQHSGVEIPVWLVAHFFLSIVDAVAWLHKQDLYHGDLHPDNIIVSPLTHQEHPDLPPDLPPKITLVDFGTTTDLTVAAQQRADCMEIPALMTSLMLERTASSEKRRLLRYIQQPFDSWAGGPMLFIDHIWEETGGLWGGTPRNIVHRDLGFYDMRPPPEIMALINRPLLEDGKLEELIGKDGEDFELV